MEKSNVLIILGNGHNLGMGFRTSYSNFANHYLRGSIAFPSSQIYNRLVASFNESFENNMIWGDLETELKKIAISLRDDEYDRDVELEYFERLRDNLAFYMNGEAQYQILGGLYKMINDAQCSISPKSLPISLFEYILLQNKSYDIISFNYTCIESILYWQTYLLLYQREPLNLNNDSRVISYYRSRININYVHIAGTKCIFGAENDPSIPESLSFIKKINQIREDAYQCNFLQYKTILIYGHSLGQSDYDFFSRMFNEVLGTGKEIVIVTLDNSSKEEIKNNLRNLYNIKESDLGLRISFLLTKNITSDDKIILKNYLQ